MWLDLLLISLWGGIVAMDTTAALQIMISRPLIACSVAGLILGDFQFGFQVGIILELIWINEIPAGAARFSEGNVGAVAAAAIAIFAHNQTHRIVPSMVFALMLAVFISFVGGILIDVMRRLNSHLFDGLLIEEKFSITNVARAHFKGVFMAFALGFSLTLASSLVIGIIILPLMIPFIPASLDMFLEPIIISFMGAGSALLIYMFVRNNKFWYFIVFGLLGGLFFILN